MGSSPLNSLLRFALEIIALFSVDLWGWKSGNDWTKYLFAIGIPIVFATCWGVFNVPEDPSRSGDAPIVVPGLIRLALELFIFGFATWALYDSDYSKNALVFSIVVIIHYLVSYDRILWLLSR